MKVVLFIVEELGMIFIGILKMVEKHRFQDTKKLKILYVHLLEIN